MPTPLPRQPAEPTLPQAAGAGALRGTVYTLLGALLLIGAWIRFNPQIASVAPDLAAPVADVAARAVDAGRLRGLVELALLPVGATAEAVADMGLPTDQAATLTEAVRRGRLRLVRLPLFDFGLAPDDTGTGGRAVAVEAGGYTRVVRLARLPVTLTVPMGPVGTVAFRNLDPGPVAIGALTLDGPLRLPDLPTGSALTVGVVAQ